MSAARRDLSESSTGADRDDEQVDRVAALEARVSELQETLASIMDRVQALERSPRAAAPLRSGPRQTAATPSRPVEEPVGESVGTWATILGRTFLILGGAYLLRALTEAGIVSQGLGPAIAFAYAHVWLVLAYRAKTAKGAILDRTAYGVAFALVAFPLVVETTTRFHLLSPAQGAVGLAVAAATGTAVAWRRGLRALGWVVSFMALLSATAIAVNTQAWPAMMLVAVGLGVAIDFVTAERDWTPLRVSFAASVDIVVVGLFTPIVLLNHESTSLLSTIAQLSLFVGYMGLYSVRSLTSHRSLSTFERIQLTAVLFIGYIGGVLGALHAASLSRVLAGASLLAGGAAYAVAYFLFVRRAKDATEAWFNTSYALVGVIVGSWVLIHDPAYPWLAIAVLLTVLGMRDRYAALPVHGAVLGLFAAVASGLVTAAGYAFVADAHHVWPELTLQGWIALAISAFVYFAPLERDTARRQGAGKAAKVLALVVLVFGLGGVVISKLLVPLVDGGTPGADEAWLAALRTGVVVVAALMLAAMSRVERFCEARLLVYPVLAAGGLKLALEDFPNGSAVTLAVACVCYGAALVVAPRLQCHAVEPARAR